LRLILAVLLSFLSTEAIALSATEGSKGAHARIMNQSVRVQFARKEIGPFVDRLFAKAHLDYPGKLYLRAFKLEQELEVWGYSKKKKQYVLITTYPFTGFSGKLGPKREEGDDQIPEGFYHISFFNVNSDYFLSLKINYPNRSDLIHTTNPNEPGGDIMIHGSRVTIGCIPIGDFEIGELFVMAIDSHDQFGTIPIHIYPFHMENPPSDETRDIMSALGQEVLSEDYPDTYNLWKTLLPTLEFFEEHRLVPQLKLGRDGFYQMAE
jgi:hypothetical protein